MQLQLVFVFSASLGLVAARRNHTQGHRQRVRQASIARRSTSDAAHTTGASSSIHNSNDVASATAFTCYDGNGSNWPGTSQWVSFDSMWSGLLPGFGQGCSGYGANSGQETQDVLNAINNIASQSQVDPRLILAIIMNESSGCVRAPTTPGGSGIFNPGLMQDYDGHNTCNCEQNDIYNQDCGLVSPCPQGTISGMIADGTTGTSRGDGLEGLISTVQNSGAQGAQVYYRAATFYNKGIGSVSPNQNLPQYAIKVANWVTGWQGASSYNCGDS